MLLVNDVYQYLSRRYRILWKAQQIVYWIDIDKSNALPEQVALDVLVGYLSEELMHFIEDPFESMILNPTKDSQWAQDIQKKSWAMIGKHVSNEPAIFDPRQRGKMVDEMVCEFETTKALVYRKLRVYWQKGKSARALYPDTSTKGGRDKPKSISENKKGRPRKHPISEGINITPQIQSVFRAVIDVHYLSIKRNPARHAYRKGLLALGFDPTKKSPEYLSDAPTYKQFYYFLCKEISNTGKVKARIVKLNAPLAAMYSKMTRK